MAIQLMKLRHVPEDELVDILRLLDEHAVDYYQTSAGAFGISLPALWLRDTSREEEVRALLEAYAQQRLREAREARERLDETHGARTVLVIFREAPFKFIFRLAVIGFLLWISIQPFML